MPQYTLTSIERYDRHLVLAAKPQSEHDRLTFYPGQYAAIGFQPAGRLSPMRCFSIISSPRSQELQFAIRLKGRFTHRLADLKPGSILRVQGPFGDFTIDPAYDRKIVMLAAGIGITPFMSMLRHAAETRLSNPITLVYASRSRDDIAFFDELQSLTKRLPHFRVIFLISEGLANHSQHIYHRKLDAELLDQIIDGQYQGISYFMCGPAAFITDMRATLERHEVADSRIITESFTQTRRLGWKLRLGIPSLTYAATGATMLAAIAAIMVIDVVRYVPKTQAAAGKQTSSSTNPTSTLSTDSTSSTTSTDNTSSGASNTPSDTPTTQTYQQTYQAPVTSVS